AALLGAFLFVLPAPAWAGPTFDACAAAAASRFEAGMGTIGVDATRFDTPKAVGLCEAALDEDSGQLQVRAWLGRALVAAGDPARALPLLEEASAAGNVVAQSLLGDLLIAGSG